MTLLKPHLSLRRLAVYHRGDTVYDEIYKKGVNIIRGSNSSGKSTIADFIFFALGGDIKVWKPEAERCEYVMAEVEINEAVFTLKRSVSDSRMKPMALFWGPFEKAIKSGAKGWQLFPFQRSANKESYSQVLFRILGFPEVRSDLGNNITMHQVLRLIYVDQLSSVQSLMRDEMFDSPLTRKTVGDVLFGIYDDSLYKAELDLRDRQKELEHATSQFQSILEIFGQSEQTIELLNSCTFRPQVVRDNCPEYFV